MKQCLSVHQDACESLRLTSPSLLLSPLPTFLRCLPTHTPHHHHPVLYCGKWRLLSLIFLFSLLSSLHSLQLLPTYLTLTEQCCSRRALKDRLDCLGILIPHFLFFILLGQCALFSVPRWYCLSTSVTCNCNCFCSALLQTNTIGSATVYLLCALVRNVVKTMMCVGVFVCLCVFLCLGGGSASSVWVLVITVLHCLCRSQWSWTHCLSLHGSQQLCEFPSDIAAPAKPASCIFYHTQRVSVCPLSLSLSLPLSRYFCVACLLHPIKSYQG